MIESLQDATSGRYVLATRNGTQHFLDLDAHTITRRGATGREWTATTDFGFGPAGVSDGEPFWYTFIEGLAVGECIYASNFRGEWRRSSTIVSIEEIVTSGGVTGSRQAADKGWEAFVGMASKDSDDSTWVCARHVAFLPCRKCPGVSEAPSNDPKLVELARLYHAGEDSAREAFFARAVELYLAPQDEATSGLTDESSCAHDWRVWKFIAEGVWLRCAGCQIDAAVEYQPAKGDLASLLRYPLEVPAEALGKQRLH